MWMIIKLLTGKQKVCVHQNMKKIVKCLKKISGDYNYVRDQFLWTGVPAICQYRPGHRPMNFH